MQLMIHIKNTKDLALPLNYNYQLMSVVYRLTGSDEEFSEFLHEKGWRSGGASFRMFCFSPLSGHYRIENKQIIFDGSISFELRSPSEDLIRAVRTELFEKGCFKLFDTTLEVRMLECYDRRFDDDAYRIRTLSPIALRQRTEDGRSVYYSPEDREFDELINLNLYRKFNAAFGTEPPSTVDLTLASRPKKVVTKIKDTWVTAYHASFEMYADPSVTQFLYDTGLGSRNSQGFGMFKILE